MAKITTEAEGGDLGVAQQGKDQQELGTDEVGVRGRKRETGQRFWDPGARITWTQMYPSATFSVRVGKKSAYHPVLGVF